MESLFSKTSDVPFCEGKINGIPEIWNTTSSLFISFVAYVALRCGQLNDDVRSIYYVLFMNGFGSMGYHWVIKGSIGYIWKMFDQFTMILALWMGITSCIKICKNSNLELYSIHTLNLFMLICSSCEYDDIFRFLFGIQCLFLLRYYRQMTFKLYYQDYYNFGYRGLKISIIAGLFWVMTEIFCNKYLILGHTVWHIGIAYGMHMVLQFINSIKVCLPTISKQTTLTVKKRMFIPILSNTEL